MALMQSSCRARVATNGHSRAMPASLRPCVFVRAGLRDQAFAAGLASLLLASPAFAGDAPSYDEQLFEIVKARGTSLELSAPAENMPAAALEEPAPVTVQALEAAPTKEQRTELIRAEAIAEAEAAKALVDSTSTASPGALAPASRTAAARKSLSASSSAGAPNLGAALGVLTVLGVAGGAAAYMQQLNGGTQAAEAAAPTVAAAPPLPAAAEVAPSAEDKTPRPV